MALGVFDLCCDGFDNLLRFRLVPAGQSVSYSLEDALPVAYLPTMYTFGDVVRAKNSRTVLSPMPLVPPTILYQRCFRRLDDRNIPNTPTNLFRRSAFALDSRITSIGMDCAVGLKGKEAIVKVCGETMVQYLKPVADQQMLTMLSGSLLVRHLYLHVEIVVHRCCATIASQLRSMRPPG